MPQPVRVLLVDTPALPRSCLAAVLNRRRWLQVVGEAGTGSDALAEVRSLQRNVVLDVVAMDGMPPSRYGWDWDRLLDPLRRWHSRGDISGAQPAEESELVAPTPLGSGTLGAREERAHRYAA
jgi:hypothetical protein